MSVLDQFRAAWATAEQDIKDVLTGGLTINEITIIAAHIKADIAVAQGDLDSALQQLVKLSPTIVSDIQATLAMVTQLAPVVGIALPAIGPEIAAAQAVVAGLQALASAQQGGSTSAEAIVAGVTAANQAAGAKAAVVLAALNNIGVK